MKRSETIGRNNKPKYVSKNPSARRRRNRLVCRPAFLVKNDMAGFGKTTGPADPDEDVIIIHLGRNLTDEQFERVQQSVIAFMNARWPNVANIGIDN